MEGALILVAKTVELSVFFSKPYLYMYKYLRSSAGNFDRFPYKFDTNISFCKSLNKFVSQNYPKIVIPQNVGFKGRNENFWTNVPFIRWF